MITTLLGTKGYGASQISGDSVAVYALVNLIGVIVSIAQSLLLYHYRFLKSVLQYTENMAILTGPDKNKWDECCKLTTAMVDKVTAFFTKWHQK